MHSYIQTYIHTYIHTHTHIHTYIHTHTCIHTNIHTYVHTYIHTCIHTYIHTHIHTYIHTYTHAYIHTYVRTYGMKTEKHKSDINWENFVHGKTYVRPKRGNLESCGGKNVRARLGLFQLNRPERTNGRRPKCLFYLICGGTCWR